MPDCIIPKYSPPFGSFGLFFVRRVPVFALKKQKLDEIAPLG